jgi:hypothetical protein
MAFVKRDVKDRVVQYPRRYQLVEVQPGIFDLIPVTGTVTEEGTPVNKELLQRYEDGLDAALEKTGDGKDVTVTFSEAATEAHIASGEKLSTMFGKILKKFKNVAPTSHASSANTYGVGTTSNFGHCKTINNLTQASHVNGNALSAYQGKLMKDLIDAISAKLTITRGSVTYTDTIASQSTIIKNIPIGANKTKAKIYIRTIGFTDDSMGVVEIQDSSHAYARTSIGTSLHKIIHTDYGDNTRLVFTTGSYSGIFGDSSIQLKEAYISGSNLVLVLENTHGSASRTLSCKILWEVQ